MVWRSLWIAEEWLLIERQWVNEGVKSMSRCLKFDAAMFACSSALLGRPLLLTMAYHLVGMAAHYHLVGMAEMPIITWWAWLKCPLSLGGHGWNAHFMMRLGKSVKRAQQLKIRHRCLNNGPRSKRLYECTWVVRFDITTSPWSRKEVVEYY